MLDGKVLVTEGGLQGWLLKKLLEASPMADEANSSWLQDGSATDQG